MSVERHVPANCPYFLLKTEERLETQEKTVSGNGLQARIRYLESDAFAIEIGERIAEHVWKCMGKVALGFAIKAGLAAGIAISLAILERTGVI